MSVYAKVVKGQVRAQKASFEKTREALKTPPTEAGAQPDAAHTEDNAHRDRFCDKVGLSSPDQIASSVQLQKIRRQLRSLKTVSGQLTEHKRLK